MVLADFEAAVPAESAQGLCDRLPSLWMDHAGVLNFVQEVETDGRRRVAVGLRPGDPLAGDA